MRPASSRACDSTDALYDLRPPDRLDGATGTLGGVKGRRAAGAATRSRRAAPAEPRTQAGLGRSDGARRPGPAPAQAAEDEPAGDAGPSAALLYTSDAADDLLCVDL